MNTYILLYPIRTLFSGPDGPEIKVEFVPVIGEDDQGRRPWKIKGANSPEDALSLAQLIFPSSLHLAVEEESSYARRSKPLLRRPEAAGPGHQSPNTRRGDNPPVRTNRLPLVH